LLYTFHDEKIKKKMRRTKRVAPISELRNEKKLSPEKVTSGVGIFGHRLRSWRNRERVLPVDFTGSRAMQAFCYAHIGTPFLETTQ